ncbi:hypothetical protein G647_01110 [Cladophialophora carrionii CBS 160.54]|uniref:Uncharacterized protein n=1 Tax=Cladophialophora carrionii CBS 160.54 TaxID=1279043 RepID=V9DP28_9EURO|nr:uncharacterized protein G647_01110 [Cladophialophora carrionii CBS 160.54]ETI28659.1 hypothetical protein G647_01110 [Cladophialophora carrionii CBS 160.54]
MGNWVIQFAIWDERDGSFHHGLNVQAGAADVEFREVVVVAVFVPEQVVAVSHEVMVVRSGKTVPLDVTLDTVSLHVMYSPAEQELDELDELEVVEVPEVLNDCDGSGEPDCSTPGSGPEFCELPVVHGAAVQCVTGNVNEADINGGIGGKCGGDGGKGNPNLPKHGMWQFVNRLRIHFTASPATDIGFPQLSLHNGPRHFQSNDGKTIQPPAIVFVL